MKQETVTINVLTEKDIKRIAQMCAGGFDSQNFGPSLRREIRRAIETGIREALAFQRGEDTTGSR